MRTLSERLIRASIATLCLILLLRLSRAVNADAPYHSALAASDVAIEVPVNRGAAAVWQSLRKLHTRASLLMVTAHPDDEDGGMLTYESRGEGAQVTLLTLNRGEGGANVMSSDYFDALGLVRTEELLAADRYYGVDQYWTRVIDYGFSKTKEECLEKWGHDRVLYDVVRVVRMTRPLVITSVFVGGPTDGHGNHQVAGQMAQEAFKAAGDPNMFPDQIKAGLRPWSAMKEYARVPYFLEEGHVNPKGVYDYATHKMAPTGVQNYIQNRWEPGAVRTNLAIPEGQYEPVLGLNYTQVSREGLGCQKSQNGGTGVPAAGPRMSPYHRFGSVINATENENSFFDGIDISLLGIASLAKSGDTEFLKRGLTEMNATVEEAMSRFSADHPERVAASLTRGLNATDTLLNQVAASNLSDDAKYNIAHELEVKKGQFNEALVQALGVSLRATVAPEQEPNPLFAMFMGDPDTFRVAIPGQQFHVKVHVVNQSPESVGLDRVELRSAGRDTWSVTAEGQAAGELASNQAADWRFKVKVPDNPGLTRPYFERPDIEQPYYNIIDERALNLPLAPYPLSAWAEFTYAGGRFRVGQVVQSVKRVTGYGQVLEPLIVAPPISVLISPHAGIVPLDAKSFAVTATIHSNVKGPAKGTLKLDLPPGWQSRPSSAEFSTAQDGEEQSLTLEVLPTNLKEESYTLTALVDYNGHTYKEGYQITGYPGLRPYFLYKPSTYRTSGVDVKVAKDLNAAYVMGSGDDVPAALENLGVRARFLSPADLASADLSKFDVIVLGVRTYAARQDLTTYNERLLDYVKNGGVVIVQYNTPEYDHNYGPYPYKMTGDPEEVTDEASKVEILDPANPVFTWPNKITEKDFKGWVEERGSKFMQSWDPRYEPLLETHDAGQDLQKGGLLYARYGKGVYIYNAYALYRQLPEGVPGAYRILANLVSLAHNPGVERGQAGQGR
jgi:LmbE family N-acetylglucosaminyl deacetylase